MAHIVMCRLCKKRFDADTEPYVVENKQSYYHAKCHEEWIEKRNNINADLTENEWYETLIDYLYRDVKMPIDFQKVQSQWKNFIKPEKNMTPKGIFFAVKYFYDVMHGNTDKALGGIGIVPSIYNKSAEYWIDKENKEAGTLEAIIQEMKKRKERPVQAITQKKNKKENKSKWTLDDI